MHPRTIIVFGLSWWNRASLQALLAVDGNKVAFHDDFASGLAAVTAEGGALLAWASKIGAEHEAAARAAGIAITYVEDGFLRSVGLGAALARGGSYVLDQTGIYYDASRPSDLETMLETANVGADETARAGRLRQAILIAGISKYNVGRRSFRLDAPVGRERVLVVGQVAVDAGVRRTLSATIDCAESANVNLDLLAAAREQFPRAYIIYKPHPDVSGGLRPGHIDAPTVARYADVTIPDADVIGLIEATDRLVTLSSLSGFEALLRGKTVTVHGLPFYAGWGLTDDTTTCSRRTRRRRLDELVAIALLRYGRYVDPASLAPCTPETLVARLSAQRASPLHRLAGRLRQHASWAGRRLGL